VSSAEPRVFSAELICLAGLYALGPAILMANSLRSTRGAEEALIAIEARLGSSPEPWLRQHAPYHRRGGRLITPPENRAPPEKRRKSARMVPLTPTFAVGRRAVGWPLFRWPWPPSGRCGGRDERRLGSRRAGERSRPGGHECRRSRPRPVLVIQYPLVISASPPDSSQRAAVSSMWS
jgi:hypothetical protein